MRGCSHANKRAGVGQISYDKIEVLPFQYPVEVVVIVVVVVVVVVVVAAVVVVASAAAAATQ